MTTSAEHTTRQKLPICPEWCAGHTDTYQGWERIEGGGVARSHASDASDYPMMRATWTDAFGNGTGLDDEVASSWSASRRPTRSSDRSVSRSSPAGTRSA
jgi:hypothetical protein